MVVSIVPCTFGPSEDNRDQLDVGRAFGEDIIGAAVSLRSDERVPRF